jgi:hypothetical protein
MAGTAGVVATLALAAGDVINAMLATDSYSVRLLMRWLIA